VHFTGKLKKNISPLTPLPMGAQLPSHSTSDHLLFSVKSHSVSTKSRTYLYDLCRNELCSV